MQKFYNELSSLKDVVQTNNFSNIFIVTSKRIANTQFVLDALNNANVNYSVYSNFTPNPKMEEAREGLDYYKKGKMNPQGLSSSSRPSFVRKNLKDKENVTKKLFKVALCVIFND